MQLFYRKVRKGAKVTQRAQRLILANLAESLRPLRFGKSCTSCEFYKWLYRTLRGLSSQNTRVS